MEGSESEAVFASYNLNPQLFINTVLNDVDDLVDEAFDFCQEQALALVGGETGTDRSEQLLRGVSSLRDMTQEILDKRMSMWEKYCPRECFSVPEGFSLPKDNSSCVGLLLQDGLRDTELDAHLVSLREKLAAVGRESAELQREIHALEKESVLHSSYDASLSEALRLLEENSVHSLFQGVEKTASKLHQAMEKLKPHMGDDDRVVLFENPNSNQQLEHEGLSVKLDDLQKAVDIWKKS